MPKVGIVLELTISRSPDRVRLGGSDHVIEHGNLNGNFFLLSAECTSSELVSVETLDPSDMLLSVQRTRWPEKCQLRLKARTVTEKRDELPTWIGRLLCRVGIHDYRLVEVVGGFGRGGQVEKVECRRCGYATTKGG